MAGPLLSIEGLTKTYTEGPIEVPAVRGVTLAVHPGELVLLMGPSGSGKTTLLSMMGCILKPSAGTVRLLGEPVTDWDERRLPILRRRAIGFIFQHYNLFSALTAQENVEIALQLKGAHGAPAEAEARRLLEAVGLGARAAFLPRDLSGGEKQRVSIARALAGNPPILLADEPTGNLDSQTGRRCLELLKACAREQRKAVMIVTHDPRVEDLADHIYRMEDGLVMGKSAGAAA